MDKANVCLNADAPKNKRSGFEIINNIANRTKLNNEYNKEHDIIKYNSLKYINELTKNNDINNIVISGVTGYLGMHVLKEYFDNYCQGSVELLEGKVLYKIAENIRNGVRDYRNISDDKDF